MDVWLSRDLDINIRLSWDLNINISLGWALLVNVRLSRDLDINIWLSWDLDINIRLSKRISLGVCNRRIVRASIKTSNWGNGSTNWLSSIKYAFCSPNTNYRPNNSNPNFDLIEVHLLPLGVWVTFHPEGFVLGF